MLIDWNLDMPWWVFFILGFIVALVISTAVYLMEVSSHKKSMEELRKYVADVEQRFVEVSALSKSIIDQTFEEKKSIITDLTNKRLELLDVFKQRWVEIRRLIQTFQTCLDNHEAVNVMEASLIRSLQAQTAALNQLVMREFMDAIDPNRQLGLRGKTVKTETDGGNSGEEEVKVGIQTASEESQEHERSR